LTLKLAPSKIKKVSKPYYDRSAAFVRIEFVGGVEKVVEPIGDNLASDW
jgi:hypothetical protein